MRDIPLGRKDNSGSLDYPIRARVEWRKDPLKLGRVRVRIPQLHGLASGEEGKCLGRDELPWAWPSQSVGCGHDYGSSMVPNVGSWVWLVFEEGDLDRPIYMGSFWDKSVKKVQMNVLTDSKERPKGDESDIFGGQVQSGGEHRVIKDVFRNQGDSYEPTVDVLYKSIKGHTIAAENKDSYETFSFTDRLGQILAFICPVKASESKKRRGLASVYDDEPLKRDEVSYMQRAIILLKDVAGQFLKLDAKKDEESLVLLSRSSAYDDNDKDVFSFVNLTSKKDKPGAVLQVQKGEVESRVEMYAGSKGELNVSVLEGGALKFCIEYLDGKAKFFSQGNIDISTPGNVTIDCNQFEVKSAMGIINNAYPSGVKPSQGSKRWEDKPEADFIAKKASYVEPSNVEEYEDIVVVEERIASFDKFAGLREFADSMDVGKLQTVTDLFNVRGLQGVGVNSIQDLVEKVKLPEFSSLLRLSRDSLLASVGNLLGLDKIATLVNKSGINSIGDFASSLGVVDIVGFTSIFDGVSLDHMSKLSTLKTLQGFLNMVNEDAIFSRVSIEQLMRGIVPNSEAMELIETIAGVKDIKFINEMISGIDYSDALSSTVLASQLGVEFTEGSLVLESAVKKKFLSMVYDIVEGKAMADIRNQLGV